MKPRHYYYLTNCVCSYAKDINDMLDKEIDITYNTFFKYVDLHYVERMFKYGKHLRIKNDYAVSYHRSKYKGIPCYYLKHSGIEYIFIVEKG